MATDIEKLAEELVKLTVLEVNELKTVLKDEYGIEPAAAAVAVAAGPAAGGEAAAEESKSEYDVVLKDAGGQKIAVIKAVKEANDPTVNAMFPGWGATIAATVVAFVVGYIVIIGFLKFVSTFSYKAFAIYRIALAVVVALLLITGVLPAIDPSMAG